MPDVGSESPAAPRAESPTPATKPVVERPAVVVMLAALALLATAGSLGLFEPTETRYAEIAREMRAGGDWLIPHLDGIAHLHKPPFAYWATALGMALFGENGWGARLPVAAATTCTLVLTWIAARRRFARLAVDPALTLWILATMALPFVLGRALATDPFLAAVVAGFWAFAPSPLACALLGLGFFIKGPVVFVPTLLTVLVAAAWGRSRAPLRLLGPAWSWVLFAAIALPWYALAVVRVPGLLEYLLRDQLWLRFTTDAFRREGPPWYFVALLAAGSLPWTVALVAGGVRAWRRRGRDDTRLLVAWALVPVVFFSLSSSKLPAYILPCFPAVAMLSALGLDRGSPATRVTGVVLAALALLGATLGPRLVAARLGAAAAPAATLPPLVYVGLASWLLAAMLIVWVRAAWAAPVVLAGWVALLFGLAPYEAMLGSPRPLARVLEESRGRGEPVIEYRRFNAGLPFYLCEPVRLLDVERELFFTPPGVRATAFVTRDSLATLVARHGRVWLLAPGRSGEALARSLGLAYRSTASWQRQTLGFLEAPAGVQP